MSFYVTLPSSASTRSEYSSGTEYRTYLQKELILPENDWYVALVSFHYTGQKWGTLSVAERSFAYMRKELQYCNFVLTIQMMEKSDKAMYLQIGDTRRDIKTNNYTWHELRKEISDAYAQLSAQLHAGDSVFNFEEDDKITITKSASTEFGIVASKPLADLLTIDNILIVEGIILKYGTSKLNLTYKVPEVLSSSFLLFKHSENEDCSLSVQTSQLARPGVKYVIPPGQWSLELLSSYINNESNNLITFNFVGITDFSSETSGEYHGKLQITALGEAALVHISFSNDLVEKLGLNTASKLVKAATIWEYDFILKEPLIESSPRAFTLNKPSFGSFDALFSTINKRLLQETNGVKAFTFHLQNDCATITAHRGATYKLRVPRALLRKLAFDMSQFGKAEDEKKAVWLDLPKNESFVRGKNITATAEFAQAMFIQSGLFESKALSAFWVLTDIVNDQVVGNGSIPLLRIVPNNASENVGHIESLEGHYLPLNNTRISAINIRVCTGTTQELVPFDNDVTCVLHFMRRS